MMLEFDPIPTRLIRARPQVMGVAMNRKLTYGIRSPNGVAGGATSIIIRPSLATDQNHTVLKDEKGGPARELNPSKRQR